MRAPWPTWGRQSLHTARRSRKTAAIPRRASPSRRRGICACKPRNGVSGAPARGPWVLGKEKPAHRCMGFCSTSPNDLGIFFENDNVLAPRTHARTRITAHGNPLPWRRGIVEMRQRFVRLVLRAAAFSPTLAVEVLVQKQLYRGRFAHHLHGPGHRRAEDGRRDHRSLGSERCPSSHSPTFLTNDDGETPFLERP